MPDKQPLTTTTYIPDAWQTIDSSLTAILPSVFEQLERFTISKNFANSIKLTSNGNWNPQQAQKLIEKVVQQQQLPKIKVLPYAHLGAKGAFGNNTIYLAQELFTSKRENDLVIIDVFLEELGHYLDSMLNDQDTPGDEGAIFASLVQNQQFSSAELLTLKTKDDLAELNVNGQITLVEQANSTDFSDSFPTSRTPWEWPFEAQSIWNLPLGSNAVYTPANIQAGEWTSADVELLFQASEDDPLTRLYAPGSWTNRCSGTNSPTGNPADEIYIRFPVDTIVPDADPPQTPNNVAAILQPDGETIVSVGPLARCTPGGPVYGWYFGEENIYGSGITGSHGGSGLSALGGSIRLGELVGDDPIRHALKVNIWAEKYLYYNSEDETPGYRWPAHRADSYAPEGYGGDNPQLEMGALLALSPEVTPESLGISSIPALKLFYALQDYGAYVVDDTAWDVTAFNLQEGVREEFLATYGYEFETSDQNSQWFQEYYTLVQNLQIVTNSSFEAVGGGGERRAAFAPALAENFDSSVIGEIGRISSLNQISQTINLEHQYVNPVVFALPLSRNGRDPAIARITDIQSDSFSVYLQEPEYSNQSHQLESFSYLVLEAGTWQLEDGTLVDVGTVNTNATTIDNWETVNFRTSFTEAPVVLSQVQSNNDPTFVSTRQQNINSNSFQVALEEEEALSKTGHGQESIGWLAIAGGEGTWNGHQYQAGNTDGFNHQWQTLDLSPSFATTPQLLASLATYNDYDSAGLRYRKLDNNEIQLKVEEDRSLDWEIWHNREAVNFLAIEGTGELTAKAYAPSTEVLSDTEQLCLNGEDGCF